MMTRQIMRKRCTECGKQYHKKKTQSVNTFLKRKFCTFKCSTLSKKKHKTCTGCSKPYYKKKTQSVKTFQDSKFCTVKCSIKHRRVYRWPLIPEGGPFDIPLSQSFLFGRKL